jgi:hypothetical protein
LQTFDASSIIYAWDNYPPEQIPGIWRWIAEVIGDGGFSIPTVAFEEVHRRLPECAQWLSDRNIERIAMSNDILQEAVRIKGLLGIEGDQYSPKGVGENDLFIIATASVDDLELISNEAKQNNLPDRPANYKIPAVCVMDGVQVPCIDFITLIKRSGQVFDGSGP